MAIEQIRRFLTAYTSATPLVVFRFAFGVMMFLSTLRFVLNGWVEQLYLQPRFFFTFYGFEWVKPLGEAGMYTVFSLLMLSSLLVAFGRFYRVSIIIFFLLFTYVELIDKSNYLNHYYFISLVSFLMCLLPAPSQHDSRQVVPRWAVLAIQLQMAIVYFFAGAAKINSDWLLNAMPLKIWLEAKTHLPFIGPWLGEDWVAYVFSWCGMLFDISIAFFLFHRRTVWFAYAVVVVFHVLTAILFPGIGMFPFIMMVCATVFLPAEFHERIANAFSLNNYPKYSLSKLQTSRFSFSSFAPVALCIFFAIQLLLPLRSHIYPGNLFYHEQGYRFSWRVMLMEKAGMVFFKVRRSNGQLFEVRAADYLTAQQEKQMSTQPDMILQFAHYLQKVYNTREVYAEAYVTVNGRGSQLLIDPDLNLCEVNDNFSNKNWVLAAK